MAILNISLIDNLVYYKNSFVAISSVGAVFQSKDGTKWKKTDIQHTEPNGVEILNNKLVIWGFSPDIAVYDGKKWDVSTVDKLNRITYLFYEGDTYYGYGYYDCCFGEIPNGIAYYKISSTDLKKWKSTNIKENEQKVVAKKPILVDNVVYGINDKQIVSGEKISETPNVLFESTNSISAIAYGKKIIVIAGYDGVCKYSNDGKNWSDVNFK